MKFSFKRFFISFLFFASSIHAQIAVQWDTTNVTLANIDTDTIFVRFSDRPYQRITLSSGSSVTLKATKPGQRIYLPDTIMVFFDSTNVSGGAADSFRVARIPYNPITGSLVTASISYLLGSASTFGAITDGLLKGFPLLPWANAYAITIARCDTSVVGTQRIRTSFVRKE